MAPPSALLSSLYVKRALLTIGNFLLPSNGIS
ncbi:hypothetical protein LINGRAHAP2_LOCUS10435 [Linum grandiflorum]